MANNKKTIDLTAIVSDEILNGLNVAYIELKRSINGAKIASEKLGETFTFSSDTEELLKEIEYALTLEKWKKENYPKIIKEVKRSDTKYADIAITNITKEQLTAILRDIENREKGTTTTAETSVSNVLPDGESIPAILYTHQDALKMSLDKLSTIFFSVLAPPPMGTTNGQFALSLSKGDGLSTELGYEKSGEPEISLLYAYTFDEDALKRLGMPKKITSYDFFVQTIFDNLLESGNEIVSLTQAYTVMTGKKPAQKQLEKFANSIYKQMATTITINDKEVMEAWNKLDPEQGKTYKEIVSPVLPVQMGSEKYTANGKIIDGAIKILAPPPVLQVGKKIGQFTTIPKALLVNKIRKTDRYYNLLHYLLTRISNMKHHNGTHKILYQTIYEKTGEKTARDKQLSNECLFQILDHFKKCGWIKGYTKDHKVNTGGTGVIIHLTTTELMN